jgi:acetyl esterase
LVRRNYLDGADVDLCDPRLSPLLGDGLSGPPPALILTGGSTRYMTDATTLRHTRALRVMVDHREFASPVHGFATLFFSLGGDSATATTAMVSSLRARTRARYAGRRLLRRILPDVDFGIASMNST